MNCFRCGKKIGGMDFRVRMDRSDKSYTISFCMACVKVLEKEFGYAIDIIDAVDGRDQK